MEIKIKVLKIYPMSGDKGLKAFADVQIADDFIIRNFRIVGRNGHSLFVSPPMLFLKDPETGEIIRKPIVVLPFAEKQMIDSAILEAYQKLPKENDYENEQSIQR